MDQLGYEPLDPGFLADPYPVYQRLREESPAHFHEAAGPVPAFWALSRFDDIWNAVRDPGTFSSAQGLTFFRDEIATMGLPPNLVMLDPPRHTRLRALIGRAFTPRRVGLMEQAIRDFVRAQIDTMTERAEAGEAIDLQRDFSATIPTFVLAELFGVPEQDRLRFGPWVREVTALQNQTLSGASLTDERTGDGVQAVAEMLGYFSEVIAARRADPTTDDLIGALVTAEVEGDRLTDWDILGFCFVMTAGGSDTSSSLISHTIMLLSQHPEQRALLHDDPGLLDDALTEALRLESSVQGLARTTTREVTLHGTTIPAGEKVMMLYGSANRDPREFGPTADRFDIRRSIPRHLAFSSGPHFCIGTHIARLQTRIGVGELLTAHPTIEVDPAAGVRHPSSFVRGWESLPAHGLGTVSAR